jgi:hypothetical protein
MVKKFLVFQKGESVRRNEGFFEALQCNVQKWTEVKNGE